jgi:hypothetical protein
MPAKTGPVILQTMQVLVLLHERLPENLSRLNPNMNNKTGYIHMTNGKS